MESPSLKAFMIQMHPDIINASQNFNLETNHLGLLLKCRFLFCKSGVRLEFLTSIKLLGDADFALLGTHFD